MSLVKQWPKTLSSLVGGTIVGMIGVLFSISFATLIFQGPLTAFLPAGIGIALVSGIICRIIIIWLGSTPFAIADIDALPATLMAVSAGMIARQLSEGSPSEVFYTVVVTLALMTLLTGIFLFLLGRFKVGNLIRYIPWPVLGGFLAATGWLLVQASFASMTNQSLTLATLPDLLRFNQLRHWLPGISLGIGLFWLSLCALPDWILPVGIVGLIGLFHLGLRVTHLSLAEATHDGWLLDISASSQFWQPWHWQGGTEAHWHLVLGQAVPLVTLIVVSALAIAFTMPALELLFHQEMEVNRELKAAGLANIFSGLMGGWVGYHTLGDSSLAYQVGGQSRLTNVTAIGFYGLVLAMGVQPLSLFPKFILGGLLLWLGLAHLKQWLYDTWFTLPKRDYGVIVLMVIGITSLGFLSGIVIGLGVAISMFIYQYSQTPVVKYQVTAAQQPSKIARTRQQSQLLQTAGEQIHLIELQGFLFFGSVYQLLSQIRQRIENPDAITLRFIILSFRFVEGLDASAVMHFSKLAQLTQQHQIKLVFTQLTPPLEQRLIHQLTPYLQSPQADRSHPEQNAPNCLSFAHRDQGIAWCEDQILAEVPWRRQRFLPLALQLEQQFESAEIVTILMDYLEPIEKAPNDWLFQPGESAHYLYFIESGQVTLWATGITRQQAPLGAWGSGHWLGALAFIRQSLYETAARIEESTDLYQLSQDAWQQLRIDHPKVANQLQSMILIRLSTDLSNAYQEITHLL